MLLESSYYFLMTPMIHTYAEIDILLCQGFSDKNILSIQSDQMRQIFDDLYWSHIMGRDKMEYSIVYDTAAIM